MSLEYLLFRIPRTREELAKFAARKNVPVEIKTIIQKKEDIVVQYVAHLSFTAGKKSVRQNRVYRSGFAGRSSDYFQGYYSGITQSKANEEALKQAEYFGSLGLQVTINGQKPEDVIVGEKR